MLAIHDVISKSSLSSSTSSLQMFYPNQFKTLGRCFKRGLLINNMGFDRGFVDIFPRLDATNKADTRNAHTESSSTRSLPHIC